MHSPVGIFSVEVESFCPFPSNMVCVLLFDLCYSYNRLNGILQ